MFQITTDQTEALRFQFGSLKRGQHINVKEASLPYRLKRK
jgi:hypothetical protein